LRSDRRLTEGINLLIPWFERPVIYDIRARPQQINSHSGSKGLLLFKPSLLIRSLDLQIVQISLRVLYRPDPVFLPALYRKLGLGLFNLTNFILFVFTPSKIMLNEFCRLS
jgi:prohibitin 2